MLEALGRTVYRRRWLTLILAGLFLAGSLAIVLRGGDLTTGTVNGIEANRALEQVEKVLGFPDAARFVVLFQSDSLDPAGPEYRADMQAAVEPLRHDPRVRTVMTTVDASPQLAQVMTNRQTRAAYAVVVLNGDTRQALANYGAVRKEIRGTARVSAACTGQIPYIHGLDTTLEADMERAEIFSMPLSILVLLAVFGTIVAAILPAGVGGLAVVGGIAIVLICSRFFDVAQYTVNVCSLVGLGTAIDYSLFIVSRYREHLDAGESYEDALAHAISFAGRVVLFSGLAVGIGLSGLIFFQGSYLLPLGVGGAIVVLLAIIFALTFLPALLAVLGPRINKGRVPLPSLGHQEKFWHGMSNWVMRRPLVVLVPTLSFLLLLGVPFFHIRLAGADIRVIAKGVEVRDTYEAIKKSFPDQALRSDAILVTLQMPGDVLTKEHVGQLYDFSRLIQKIPHVQRVESIVDFPPQPGITFVRQSYEAILTDKTVVPEEFKPALEYAKSQYVRANVDLLYVYMDVSPQSDEAREVVKTIRGTPQKGAHILITPPPGATMLVGGQTAADVDTSAYVWERTPRAVAFVVTATLIILLMLLGSVVLPLKAVFMNFVSIVGSFGLIVWIFQDGHLGIREPRPLEPSLPILLFCAVFGLSMDYEVLMLSRIKEVWERTGDNTRSVAEGLEKTAGLITSAALIMVCVFGAFGMARVVQMKSMGLGMTLAVFLDATLVRVLLVPATMRLFGSINWWEPEFLRKFRERLGMPKHCELPPHVSTPTVPEGTPSPRSASPSPAPPVARSRPGDSLKLLRARWEHVMDTRGMVYVDCPGCHDPDIHAICNNCKAEDQFALLADNTAQCNCESRIGSVRCTCGVSVDKKFFRRDPERERRDRSGAADRQQQRVRVARQQRAPGLTVEPVFPPWMKVAGGVLGAFLLLGVWAECGSEDGRQASRCDDEIKAMLKDPQSATFTDHKWYEWKKNHKTSAITVKVRATNSFGAFLQHDWRCEYDENGRFSYAHED